MKTPWPNKPRNSRTAKLPYAYIVNPENIMEAIPDPAMVPWVEEALNLLDNGHSTRNVSNWITLKSGKTISHQGIRNIWCALRPKSKRIKALDKKVKDNRPKTPIEKKIAKVKRKKSDARRVLTMSENKLADIEGRNDPKPTLSETLDFNAIETKFKEREVIFSPNPGPQTEFLAASEREVLFGGSAGGGKSAALLADPLRYFGSNAFNGLLLRRTNDELRELQFKSQELYPQAYPGAKWQEKKSQWTFPSGARLWMTYLERPEDVMRYQGQAFTWIGWDELTQHPTPFAYLYMLSRLRTTDPDLPLCVRSTTNPGSSGHSWVKRMFIDPAPAGKSFDATDIDTGKVLTYPTSHAKAGQPLFKRRFIPSKLSDNPYLSGDGVYEANLLSLPEMQRRQLLEGDWSIAEGAAFSEFRIETHTCDAFDIPSDWKRFRSCDYGYSSFSAVHWYAIDPSFETLYVYRELYVSKHTGRDLAIAVKKAEINDKVPFGILDSSCWHNRGQIGPSIAEEMISEGTRWRPSDRSAGARIAGRNRLHQLLKVDDVIEKPGIIFFNTCRQIIADLPVIPTDPKGGEDIDQRYTSDHTYDSIRYGVMSRMRSSSPFDFSNTVQQTSYRPADATFGY
jgi:hypothetical protein